jgi:hypothetical protein
MAHCSDCGTHYFTGKGRALLAGTRHLALTFLVSPPCRVVWLRLDGLRVPVQEKRAGELREWARSVVQWGVWAQGLGVGGQ